MKSKNGFTLIEVLIALVIVSIGFAALFNANLISIKQTARLKEKTFKHWIAMQGISMIQLGLLQLPSGQLHTQRTTMFNQTWTWQASIQPTPIDSIDKIEIRVSQHETGPFTDPLIAFRYNPNV